MTVSEFADALRQRDDFLILTHTRPDGDTLGSAAALCSGLRRAGKTAVIYPNPEVTEHYLPMVAPYFGPEREGQCVLCVDVAGEEMFPKGFRRGKADLCVDHHAKNPGFAPLTLLDGDKASCGEIVMELIELLCGELTKEEADSLYTAVSTDCGCFVYGNTRADTHRAAAHLMDCGADAKRLNKSLFRSVSYSRLVLEGLIFSSLRAMKDGQLVSATVTLDMMKRAGATEDDCDDLASLPGRVRGNRASVLVRELAPGRSKASIRTDGSVDASAVCARFGGGGHKMASGCTADLGPEELTEALLGAIAEVWP